KEKSSEPFYVERIILPDEKGQVVDQTPEANKERPDRAKFLSQFDNRVKEETRAPVVDDPSQAPPPSRRQMGQEPPKPKTPEEGSLLALRKDQGKQKVMEKESEPSWDDLTALSRRPENLSRPSASDDYLPDTKLGDRNLLNTREFLYYSYYARIKERLRMFWTPSVRRVMTRLYHAGHEFNRGELITKVRVTLNQDGSLTNIKILDGSGLRELDNIAIASFEKAAPFPNPPSGMIEENGNVYLRWDFILTTQAGTRLRVFVSQR
ncbi:TonB family protein, partial [Bdellovibrionota bacterium]